MQDRTIGLHDILSAALDGLLGRVNAIAIAVGALASMLTLPNVTQILTVLLLLGQICLTVEKIITLRRKPDED